MKIGSLFSGIGGLELGLERATGAHVVWQVEQDEYRRSVLARHWTEAKRYADVRSVRGPLALDGGLPGVSGGDGSNSERGQPGRDDPDRGRGAGGRELLSPVDILCGGFPCTDLSVSAEARTKAGRPKLEGSASGLWREYERLIGELQPAWVVVENVYAGWRDWLPVVRRDLWAWGYPSVPVLLRASDVGLPHARRRVFVLAYAIETGLERHVKRELAALESHARHVAGRLGSGPRPPCRGDVLERSVLRCGADGFQRRLDAPALAALGDAVVPACAEVIGRVIAAACSGPR